MEVSEILAHGYAEMANSMAFKDFMLWCDEQVQRAEFQVANLKPENREHFQAYFDAWQAKKQWLVELKQRIDDCKQISKELKEQHERTDGDPDLYAASSNYTPGYK